MRKKVYNDGIEKGVKKGKIEIAKKLIKITLS